MVEASENIMPIAAPPAEASLKLRPTKPEKPAKVPERTLEELENVPVKNMTEKELKKYVDYLRDCKVTAEVQLNSLKEAFTGLKKQQERTVAEYAAFKTAANTQIAFCKDTLAQAFKAVHYMAPLEV